MRRKYLYIPITMLCLLFAFSHSVKAAEIADKEEISQDATKEFIVGSELYVTEDTYLYKDTALSSILGEIKQGSIISPELILNNCVKATYAGTTGYLDISILSDTPIRVASIQTETEEMDYYQTEDSAEILFPKNHHFSDLQSADAIEAIVNYTMDMDDSNDYIIVSSSENLIIPGEIIYCAYMNSCNNIGVYYTQDQMSPCVYLEIPTWEATSSDVLDLSFLYDGQTLTFIDTEALARDIRIGFAGDGAITVYQDGENPENTVDDNGITWIETSSKENIHIKPEPEDTEGTEIPLSTENELKDDTDSADFMQTLIILVVIVVAYISVLVVVFIKKKGMFNHDKSKR